MKKKLAAAIPAALLLAATLCVFLWTGHITEFSYWRGDYWHGYHTYTLSVDGGRAWATESFEPSDSKTGLTEPWEPWERRRALTDEELRAFERLVLQTLRVQSWPADIGPSPDVMTDRSSWGVAFVCGGREYYKTGYATFPDGLREIAAALSVPAETVG